MSPEKGSLRHGVILTINTCPLLSSLPTTFSSTIANEAPVPCAVYRAGVIIVSSSSRGNWGSLGSSWRRTWRPPFETSGIKLSDEWQSQNMNHDF